MRFTGSWSTTTGPGEVLFGVGIGSISTIFCLRCPGGGYTFAANVTGGSFSVSRPFGEPGPFFIVVLGLSNGTSTTNVTGTVYSTVL